MLCNNLTHKIRNIVAEFLNIYLVKYICMGSTFCGYFTQDIKQVLLKVEQVWSTWLVSFLGSVLLFLLVTETFSGTVALTLTSTLLLGGYSELIYDNFLGSFSWTAQINSFFSLFSVGKALHSSLDYEETEQNKQGESIPGQSTSHCVLIKEYCNQKNTKRSAKIILSLLQQ